MSSAEATGATGEANVAPETITMIASHHRSQLAQPAARIRASAECIIPSVAFALIPEAAVDYRVSAVAATRLRMLAHSCLTSVRTHAYDATNRGFALVPTWC